LPQKLWLRIVWLIMATAVAYPLLGTYGLVPVLLEPTEKVTPFRAGLHKLTLL